MVLSSKGINNVRQVLRKTRKVGSNFFIKNCFYYQPNNKLKLHKIPYMTVENMLLSKTPLMHTVRKYDSQGCFRSFTVHVYLSDQHRQPTSKGLVSLLRTSLIVECQPPDHPWAHDCWRWSPWSTTWVVLSKRIPCSCSDCGCKLGWLRGRLFCHRSSIAICTNRLFANSGMLDW